MYRKVECRLTKCVMQFIRNKTADSSLRYNTTIASLTFTVIRCVLFYNSDLRRVCVCVCFVFFGVHQLVCDVLLSAILTCVCVCLCASL